MTPKEVFSLPRMNIPLRQGRVVCACEELVTTGFLVGTEHKACYCTLVKKDLDNLAVVDARLC